MDDRESEIKRFEFLSKNMESSFERLSKTAAIALAGNVAAVAACLITFKDYRDKIEASVVTNAVNHFINGAIAATIAMGIVVLVSEIVVGVLHRLAARGFDKEDVENSILIAPHQGGVQAGPKALVLLAYILPYLYSAYSFFVGLSLLASAVK